MSKKILKTTIITIIIMLISIFSKAFVKNVFAQEIHKIVLSDDQVLYADSPLELIEVNGVSLNEVMDNGNSSDDYDLKVSKIVNITKSGTYEISGKVSDGQIAINANDLDGDVTLILNNVDITCKNGPAIFVFNKSIDSKYEVNIVASDDSINSVSGKNIKQSIDEKYNTDDFWYYIEKDYDENNEYYQRYKYDGTISSDLSLNFSGSGTLNVSCEEKGKEGIESKANITFDDITLNVESLDDGINACEDHKSKITINSGNINIRILNSASEGDGIDSNGSIEINGGKVVSIAKSGSDFGLDADDGININGGIVFATGDMSEGVNAKNEDNLIETNLSTKLTDGMSLLILDDNNEEIFAYLADRSISSIVYYNENKDLSDAKIYVGKDIVGITNDFGIYTDVSSFDIDKMDEIQINNVSFDIGFENNRQDMMKNTKRTKYYVLAVLCILLIICIIIYIIEDDKSKK